MKILRTKKSFREYFHYEQLEEVRSGLWERPNGETRKNHIKASANLMQNSAAFKEAMERAVEEWEKSCRHNLTSLDSNRIAWLGHAGCCVGVRSPEECTRVAWHTLSQSEQDEANRVASEVLAEWDAKNGAVECLNGQLELMF